MARVVPKEEDEEEEMDRVLEEGLGTILLLVPWEDMGGSEAKL